MVDALIGGGRRAGFVIANSASDARHSEAEIRRKLIQDRVVVGGAEDEVFEEKLAAAHLELRELAARAAKLEAGVDHVLAQCCPNDPVGRFTVITGLESIGAMALETIGPAVELGAYGSTAFGEARRTLGRHGCVSYFPPIPRTIELPASMISLLADAEAALGRLAGVGQLVPNPYLLIRPYLLREALASTRIEGTQASLADVFEIAATGEAPSADVEEVLNYIDALEWGLGERNTLPLGVRLVREMHRRLLAGVRGRERTPGEFRTTQNWVGAGTSTVRLRASCRHRRRSCQRCWPTGSASPTTRSSCRCSSRTRCCTTSLRRCTRSSTATAGSAGC